MRITSQKFIESPLWSLSWMNIFLSPAGLHCHNHLTVGDKIGTPVLPCHQGIPAILLLTSLTELSLLSMGNRSRTARPCNTSSWSSPLSLLAKRMGSSKQIQRFISIHTCLLLHNSFITFLYLQPEIKTCQLEHNYRKTMVTLRLSTLETIITVFSSQRPICIE